VSESARLVSFNNRIRLSALYLVDLIFTKADLGIGIEANTSTSKEKVSSIDAFIVSAIDVSKAS
jgi:hypothetical protein